MPAVLTCCYPDAEKQKELDVNTIYIDSTALASVQYPAFLFLARGLAVADADERAGEDCDVEGKMKEYVQDGEVGIAAEERETYGDQK